MEASYREQIIMSESTHDRSTVEAMLKRVFQIAEIAASSDVDLEKSPANASIRDKNQPQKHEDAIPV